MTTPGRAALAAALLLVCAAPARAQMYELIGTRAQGMGGAFVAVADDATATWWNPAGLPTGANVSIVYDQADNLNPSGAGADGPAWLGQTRGLAFAYPALGLSHYRLRVSEIRPLLTNAGAAPGRQDPGAIALDLRTFSMSEWGATVGQSVGSHLVIASTLKLVQGGRVLSLTPGEGGARDRLEEAGSVEVSREWETDLDVGAMASLGKVRVGLSVKHLREPEFYDEAEAFTLERQARAGIALVNAGAEGVATITAAFDADLTTAETAMGDVRHVSAGAEAWLFARRLGLRGGMSANTIGELTTSRSVGVSLGSRSGYYADASWTGGSDESREGWSFSLRLSF
jgi:hypothetical protein